MSKPSKNQKTETKKPRNVPLVEEPQKKEQVPKILKEIFSEWSDESLLAALNDYHGDINMTISRISEGHVQQWSSSKKEKPIKKSEGTKVPNAESKTLRNFDGQKRETNNNNSNNSNSHNNSNNSNNNNHKPFEGKNRDFKGGESRKPREFKKKENSTTEWTSTTSSWDSPQQSTPTSQPVQTQPSVLAPWADKSKLNQQPPPPQPQQQQQLQQPQQQLQQLQQQQQPENHIKIEHEVKPVYAPTFAPSVQPYQPPKTIEKTQEKPVMPTTTIPTEPTKISQPTQQDLRIPTANPISKFPQPQLPPPMTNPNTFAKGFSAVRQPISAPSQETKVEKHSEPAQGLRFGTINTGLSEEISPIEPPQRIKKEESSMETTSYQNPPGFGTILNVGYPQDASWNSRGFVQQPDQAFRTQEGTQGYQMYAFMPPFYGMYANMYQKPNYPMGPQGGVTRPVQPGTTYNYNDLKTYVSTPQSMSARPPSATMSAGNSSASPNPSQDQYKIPTNAHMFSFPISQPQMGMGPMGGQMSMGPMSGVQIGQMSAQQQNQQQQQQQTQQQTQQNQNYQWQ